MQKEALFYEKQPNNITHCHLCPHECVIADSKRGFCLARKNHGGTLIAEGYGKISSCAMDPIEKKPLYHFHPGSKILSVGSYGCNFKCPFCQNWQIAQQILDSLNIITPEELVDMAIKNNSIGIAYTYNEPTIFYEYVYDTSIMVKEKNLLNVWVTNGYINKKPMEKILPYIDALNIDIKSMDDSFYKKYCKGDLQPVLDICALAKKYSHVEITNLIIPTLNDTDEHFHKLGKWIKENLGKETPLHISRYFPQYKMDINPTPIDTLKRAEAILLQYLDFVHLGNV